MLKVDRDGDVVVLAMQDGENRFNPESLAALNGALDEIEGDAEAGAAVLTGEGKFFSNGLDLEWMGSAPEGGAAEVVEGTMRLLARILLFPKPVVAAINGHSFAGGAMLALACDERVMRTDRGYFCLPEADINLPFTPGMSALIRLRLNPESAHEAMLTGRRYSAEQACAAGIVRAAVPEEEVVTTATELARPYGGKNGDVITAIKQQSYGPVAEQLRLPLSG